MANTKAFKVKNGLELQEYAKSISDSAVDVFVYDTTKDSDGGAWRYRTQNTGWYNETLNTATRGSRKEFPAVALIVSDSSNRITIYDADDPSLPMWMYPSASSTAGQTSWVWANSDPFVTISAKNGIIALGQNGSTHYGLRLIDFIRDSAFFTFGQTGATLLQYIFAAGAASTGGTTLSGTRSSYWWINGGIANKTVEKVAMTVLPNAPINSATGLPIPTIAVGTATVVSVITDSGVVNDSGATNGFDGIAFSKDGSYRMFFNRDTSVEYLRYAEMIDYTTTDGFGTTILLTTTTPTGTTLPATTRTRTVCVNSGSEIAVRGSSSVSSVNGTTVAGVSRIDFNATAPETSLINVLTHDYSTGWMNGDIKLATLSDTDATDVTGSELVTNGQSPISSTSGWLGAYGNETLSIVSNALQADADATGGYGVSQLLSGLSINKKYTVTATVDFDNASDGLANLRVAINQNLSGSPTTYATTTGTHTFTFTPPSTNIYIGVVDTATSASNYVVISNISVRLAEEDRSINDNGLQVFGTVTKSAVATNAELVAYSGFDSSNNLFQPFNADICDIGTGDFAVMGWIKTPDATTVRNIISVYESASVATGFNVSVYQDGTVYLYTKNSGAATATQTTGGTPVDNDTWMYFTALRRNDTLEVYINGILDDSVTGTNRSISNCAGTYIGYQWSGDQSAVSNMALLRVSATAPSPEQIKKIYEDEKFMFQEGAQVTSYDTNVNQAIAYDDSTDLFYVGTGDGRSAFQGLRRVDNTTNGVSVVISASNDLVAEE